MFKPIDYKPPESMVKSQRGGKKLCFEGYSYVIGRIYDVKIAWRCTKRTCSGSLSSTLSYDFMKYTSHNRPPSFDKDEKNI